MPIDIFRHPDTNIPVLTRSGAEAAACGHRYNLLYNLGVQDDSDFSLRGVACHKVKRRYVERLHAAQTDADMEEFQLAFREGVAEAKTPAHLIGEVYDICQRHAQNFALNRQAFVAAERKRVRLDVPLPYQFEPDLEYIHADRDEVEIDDGKSYYRPFTEAQARELFQTQYYMWAAMQEFPGFATYRMTYSFWRLNAYVTTVYTAADFPMLDDIVHAYDAARRHRYETQDWAPNPGEVCGFCSLQCPLMDDPKLAHRRVTTRPEFVDVAGRVLVLEKELKRAKDALKAFCVANGEQNVNSEVWAFRPSVSRTYPVANVVDALRARNKMPDFTVSASTLKAIFKATPELRADLAEVERSKTTMKFGHKSLKSDLCERDRQEEEE